MNSFNNEADDKGVAEDEYSQLLPFEYKCRQVNGIHETNLFVIQTKLVTSGYFNQAIRELCITNMHQIRKFKDRKVTHKELRLNLAYCNRPPADFSRLKGKHFSTSAKMGGKIGKTER